MGALRYPQELASPHPRRRTPRDFMSLLQGVLGAGAPRGRIWEGKLFLVSVHLGFHKQRLPLLCGPQPPLLLLPEVFLLG